MQTPLTITFRHVDRSAAVETRVQELFAKLERLSDRITGCRVIIEKTTDAVKGTPFVVKVDLTLPGRELFASNAQHLQRQHEDVYVALNDVFDRAKRQLQDHLQAAVP